MVLAALIAQTLPTIAYKVVWSLAQMAAAQIPMIFALTRLIVLLSLTTQQLQAPSSVAMVPRFALGMPANAQTNNVKMAPLCALMVDASPNA